MRVATDERYQLTGLDRQADVAQDPRARVVFCRDEALFEGRQRRQCRRGVPEPHVVELDASTRIHEVDGIVGLLDERREVEHLEDAFERNERGHHVHSSVRELGERLVDLAHIEHERRDRPGRDSAIDRKPTAEVVHDRGSDRGDEAERREQHSRVHRRRDADVAHAPGTTREELAFTLVTTEQLDDQRARDVEPLGDGVVHRGIQLHRLARRDLELPPDPAGRDDEGGEHEQREDRQAPFEAEHHRQRDDQHDDVRNDRPDRVGHRLLGTDDVVVEPRHEGARLCAGEEGDRHALHVVEQRDPHVVDQAFTDLGRIEPLEQRQRGGCDGDGHRPQGKEQQEVLVAVLQGIVDQGPEQQRLHRSEAGGDDHGDEEADQRPLVGPGEAEHPSQQGALDLPAAYGVGVVAEPHHRLVHRHAHDASNLPVTSECSVSGARH